MTQMADQAMTFVIDLLTTLALPTTVLMIACWKAAKVKGLKEDNQLSRTYERIATLQEQIAFHFLDPLFQQC